MIIRNLIQLFYKQGELKMFVHIPVSERLIDLRYERHITQEELAETINLPATTYSDYEKEGNPIPHEVIIALAKYYGVSTDFLLALTDNRSSGNADLQSLHLSDSALEFLQNKDTNTRLLSEILSHEAFADLLRDAEVFVDGYFEDGIHAYNSAMNTARIKVEKAANGKKDAYTEMLNKVCLLQDDYMPQVLAKDFLPIINDIKEAHKKDSSTSDGLFNEENLNRIMETVRNTPGGPVKKFGVLMSEILKIRKTATNMALAEKTAEEPSAENIAELVNHSDLMGSNPRKRKSKKAG